MLAPVSARLTRALALALALALPATSEAGPRKSFDTSTGLKDPRKSPRPAMHRFRLGVQSGWLRLTRVQDAASGRFVRFHFAPMMLSLAYQLQFAKVLMLRPSLNAGPNVANSRYAMPWAFSPQAHFGYQGRRFGLAAGYGYFGVGDPLITVNNGGDGRPGAIGGPIISRNHAVMSEVSFTSRVDRVALVFSLGFSMVRSRIRHYDLNNQCERGSEEARGCWRPMLNLTGAVFFDGTIRRERDAQRRAREAGLMP
jgi:hypothetical protein